RRGIDSPAEAGQGILAAVRHGHGAAVCHRGCRSRGRIVRILVGPVVPHQAHPDGDSWIPRIFWGRARGPAPPSRGRRWKARTLTPPATRRPNGGFRG